MSRDKLNRVSLLVRWLRFNLVGVLGILVQLAVLASLAKAGVGYLWATALAVETAVLHNWVWHEHYTWNDRTRGGLTERLVRLLKFNVSNGAISLLGNLMLMHPLVGRLRCPLLLANMIAITVCSLVNFAMGDLFVFPRGTHDRFTSWRVKTDSSSEKEAPSARNEPWEPSCKSGLPSYIQGVNVCVHRDLSRFPDPGGKGT